MKILPVALILCLPATVELAGDINFPIKNNGDSDLISFEFNESGTNVWTNIFEDGKLERGTSTDVVLQDAETCVYDIKASFSDGSTLDETAVNLCELSGGYNFE